MRIEERMIVALDFPDWEGAERAVSQLPQARHFKVGLELYLSSGGSAVRMLKGMGKEVFLDLKFHDIPQTVAGAVRQAVASGADMFNVHCSGGPEMLKAAVNARDEGTSGESKPVLIGVTVLTSLDDADLKRIGFADADASTAAVRLAGMARECGLDGVVCSPHEITLMRKAYGKDFRLVTPGVRPSWSEKGDQKRVFTPKEAMAAGSDYIVVGRPITKATNPDEAFRAILDEMGAGLK